MGGSSFVTCAKDFEWELSLVLYLGVNMNRSVFSVFESREDLVGFSALVGVH
jgi:hypothetical protein